MKVKFDQKRIDYWKQALGAQSDNSTHRLAGTATDRAARKAESSAGQKAGDTLQAQTPADRG